MNKSLENSRKFGEFLQTAVRHDRMVWNSIRKAIKAGKTITLSADSLSSKRSSRKDKS